jgi:hypothetical protein
MNTPWTRGPLFDPAAASITGGSITTVNGVPYTLAQSFVAVTAPLSDTSEQVLATITVPANTLGLNGVLRIHTRWNFTTSANIKSMRVRFSGAAGAQHAAVSATAATSAILETRIANAGSTSAQVGHTMLVSNGTASPGVGGAAGVVDTTAATTIVISGEKALGSETLTLTAYMVEVVKLPGG